MKTIKFEDARADIVGIDDGMVEPILNMVFVKELIGGSEICYMDDGSVWLDDEQMAMIYDCDTSISTIKTVKKLGNAIAVAIGMECRALGIEEGDEVEIIIKKKN